MKNIQNPISKSGIQFILTQSLSESIEKYKSNGFSKKSRYWNWARKFLISPIVNFYNFDSITVPWLKIYRIRSRNQSIRSRNQSIDIEIDLQIHTVTLTLIRVDWKIRVIFIIIMSRPATSIGPLSAASGPNSFRAGKIESDCPRPYMLSCLRTVLEHSEGPQNPFLLLIY